MALYEKESGVIRSEIRNNDMRMAANVAYWMTIMRWRRLCDGAH